MSGEPEVVFNHQPFEQPVTYSRDFWVSPGIVVWELEVQLGLESSQMMSPSERKGIVVLDWGTFDPKKRSKIDPPVASYDCEPESEAQAQLPAFTLELLYIPHSVVEPVPSTPPEAQLSVEPHALAEKR
jgi:hypothetical protein